MDTKYDKSAKQCVNCSGRTDHETADCPVMHYGTLDPQQRLDVARGEQPQAGAAQSASLRLPALRSADDYWGYTGSFASEAAAIWNSAVNACAELSAAQSAPAGEREAFEAAYETGDLLCLDGPYDNPRKNQALTAWMAGAAWQRTQSAGVPEGWRLVPVVITDAMADAAGDEGTPTLTPHAQSQLRWSAMLAAAPAQPAAHSVPYPDGTDEALERTDWAPEQASWQRTQSARVPDAIPMRPFQTVDRGSTNYAAGWNACRKAMLAAAPAQPAAHDQGEVQRLREALRELRASLDPDDWIGEARMIDFIDAALTASTGQEVKP